MVAIAILVGFVISFAAGWSIAACDALFRAEERPGIFRGTAGMILLLIMAGVGGFTGTLLTGLFAVGGLSATAESPAGSPGLLEGNAWQVVVQAYGILCTIIWSAALTWILLNVIALFVPLRVSQEHEIAGLDITQHGEALQ